MIKLDLLCFGAHPDDVEIGMSGTIYKHTSQGYRVGICDLTLAELSSNGTITKRQAEANKAASILGIKERLNLGFPDRGLEMRKEFIGTIVNVIRQYQPTYIFVPYPEDRHPDHGQAAYLVKEAVFNAGIRKYQYAKEESEPHKVDQLIYYMINSSAQPDLLVDITPYIERKKQALLAYESQFAQGEEHVQTRLNTGFIEVILGRDQWFGKMNNVSYAEGFKTDEPYRIQLFGGTKGEADDGS